MEVGKTKKKTRQRQRAMKAPQAGGVGRQLQLRMPVGVTPEGWDWVVQAIDPFHDFKREIRGYPDMDNSNTVVRSLQGTLQIAAPGGGNWDCHIFTMPVARALRMYSAAGDSGILTIASDLNVLMGLVNVAVGSSPLGVPDIAYNWPDAALGEDLRYKQSRLIAMGLEVVNTTAELYKQGTVTCYRSPARAEAGDGYYDDEKKVDPVLEQRAKMQCIYVGEPPVDPEHAMLYPDSLQWEAKHGVYMPVTLNGVENPIRHPVPLETVVTPTPLGVDATTYVCQPLVDNVHGNAIPQVQKVFPINTAGIFFTGLSEQTTLTLRIKAYFEIAPTSSSGEVLQCATPSAGYDAKALQLYSLLSQKMPIATWSENNANGDWFKSVLSAIRMVADPIMAGIGKLVPVGGMYSRGANWLEKAVDKAGKVLPFLP